MNLRIVKVLIIKEVLFVEKITQLLNLRDVIELQMKKLFYPIPKCFIALEVLNSI
jgi:hypothetical protein